MEEGNLSVVKKKIQKTGKKCVYMFQFPQTFSGVTELRAEERAFSVGALELLRTHAELRPT